MGLIIEKIKIKWNSSNRKHFESLGYKWTKKGDEFEVWSNELSLNSKIKIHCNCDKCKTILSWAYKDYKKCVKEDGKTYCQKCAMKLYGIENNRKSKINNRKSKINNRNITTFYDWCIENNRQDVLDRWDYELNGYSPKDISYSSHEKCWLKCNKHPEHKSELKSINSFTGGHEGVMNCKQCNSIAQYILDNFPNKKLEEVWDFDKNGDLDPWEIQKGSNIRCWFICQEKNYHESYKTRSNEFCNGRKCPYCASRKVHKLDSLAQYVIDNYGEEFLWRIWSKNNNINPFEITPYSSKKVWWNCPDEKHEEFYRDCAHSSICEFRCPKCMEERDESLLEEKTRLYLEELGYEVKTEYNCSIKPINPKSKLPLPFDNEIILKNGKHLIIEVHGKQHYTVEGFYNKTEEDLYKRRIRDRYKRIKCIQAGYEYLEIPYWKFDKRIKKYDYKYLINNKINEIMGII